VPDPLVLPDYRPTLPALVRRRLGLPLWLTVAVVAALAALAGLAVVLVQPGRESGEQLVHRGEPTFNLVYEDALRVVEPGPGELARLEGRRGRVAVAVTVSPLALPSYRGDAAHGLLPAFASGHIERLRATEPAFQLREQLRARVHDAPGYEIAFRSGPRVRRTFARDILLVPAEEQTRDAVILGYRQAVRGAKPLSKADQRWTLAARKALRSFAYGTGRP
jgi:hypothetical protein